ncbi:DNA mismatch repair protein MutS [Clostridium homopropionicum DSM 5847]|uniref:DNA mismatch repair protein MutS n=1 Tax=Clostridium homopropionicum DSM 5847 TaxID=1121318 RepID=A0A0L6ZBK8_9CLOT|nr:DNA mismatch repair protein MutS [Clostridium homopropionicum]KOA20351.1 DNA mismatch repair protein MutS [Clostridium homopropionicum DSM 5847]SFG73832.1 MutS domain V [Clostridium homopropionicum]
MDSFLIYVVLVILIVSAISIVTEVRNRIKTKKRIREEWAKERERKYTDEDWDDITEYFNNIKKHKKDSFFIDEITWNDLSMDKVFEKINSAETTVGEQYLYSMLREIIYDENDLKARDEMIDYFREHKEEREKIQYILSRLGKVKRVKISDYFLDNEGLDSSGVNWYRILGFLPIISILIILFNKSIGASMLIASALVNFIVYYSVKKKIAYKLESFSYIVLIVKCAHSLYKENFQILTPFEEDLKNALSKVGKIKDAIMMLNTAGSDIGIIIEYINAVFLISITNYKSLSKMLLKSGEEFNKIFQIVGIIDSCISVAAYRERLPYFVKPELLNQKNKNDLSMIGNELSHPLIEKSVPNSITIKDSILLTGSNSSGKSTFLKTLAINAIFAQTIYTCFAKDFRIPFMQIFTSMALKDNLFNNESYYIAETKSLKRIINSVNDNILTICFVDEILRGTNTVERIAASAEVLKYLTQNNCICVAATHDVELTHILNKYFANYHFREQIVGDEIIFDYKIYESRSNTQNAIKLLSILGYEKSIVESANKRAENFLNSGVWKEE